MNVVTFDLVVDGSSDDLDAPIKKTFLDVEYARRHKLSSINSINWVRIMVQIAHYFYGALQVRFITRPILFIQI